VTVDAAAKAIGVKAKAAVRTRSKNTANKVENIDREERCFFLIL
jgi:hypothetical protein